MQHAESTWDCIVIGGGASGMMAAGRAAECGARVLLLEKNRRLGEKLRITGGGRCNVTNATFDRHLLTSRYGDQGKSLHSLFARFTPENMREFLRRYDLETKVEAEQRVFPVTDSAESVHRVLSRYMKEGGVTVRTATPVHSLLPTQVDQDGKHLVPGVQTGRGETIRGRTIILATGGTSHPETGSTGDAYPWLRELGLEAHDVDVSLVPIQVPDRWITVLQGLAMEDAGLIVEQYADSASTPKPSLPVRDHAAWANAKRAMVRRGKLLFTHFGLSGPLALNAARDLRALAADGPIRLRIDLMPARSEEEFRNDIQEAIGTAGGTILKTLLKQWLPPRLVSAVCDLCELDPQIKLAGLSKTQRQLIGATIKGLPCSFGGLMGTDRAVVSSGGLDPAAVDFRTMQVRDFTNLYVLGDLLDFNRQSGGYSLQICWASGWVAGSHVGLLAGPSRP